MLRLPSFNETTKTLSPLSAPQFRSDVTGDALAGAEARRLEQAGVAFDDAADYTLRRQNQIDLEAVFRGEAAYKELQTEELLIIRNQRGSSAIGSLVRAQAFDDGNGIRKQTKDPTFDDEGNLIPPPGPSPAAQKYKNIYGSMNDRQKLGMDKVRLQLRPAFLKSARVHEDAEILESTVRSNGISIQASINSVAADPGNEENRRIQIARIRISTRAIGDARGLNREEIEFMENGEISKVHSAVINGLLQVKDNAVAREYFVKFGDQLIGDTKGNLREIIATRTLLGKSQVEGQRIADMEEGKQEAAIRNIKDPELQKETRTVRNAVLRDRGTLAGEARRKRLKFIDDLIIGGARTLDDLPHTVLAGLEAQDILNIRDKQRKFRTPEPPSKVQEALTYELLTTMYREQPEEFKKKHFSIDHVNDLSDGNIKHFVDLQDSLIRNDRKAVDSILSREVILSDRLGLLQLSKPENALAKFVMRDMMNSVVLAEEQKTGQRMSDLRYGELVKEVITAQSVSPVITRFQERKPLTDVATLTQQISTFTRDLQDIGSLKKEARKSSAETFIRNQIDAEKRVKERELDFAERERIILSVKNNTVFTVESNFGADFLGFDREVFSYELTQEQIDNGAYVVHGNSTTTIAEINELDKEKTRFILGKLAELNAEASYKNMAIVMASTGDAQVQQKNFNRNEAGTFARPDGGRQGRAGFVENLRRLDIDLLKSRRETIIEGFGAEGERLLDIVIGEKS